MDNYLMKSIKILICKPVKNCFSATIHPSKARITLSWFSHVMWWTLTAVSLITLMKGGGAPDSVDLPLRKLEYGGFLGRHLLRILARWAGRDK